jgi:catechol 2,3-dioxygenase-like lactoylglutathione lyase family enzyme
MTRKPPDFGLQGVSHLALVSSNMARTVEFYESLGMPLIATMKLPAGDMAGQHFFFDIGNGDTLAFFWWEQGPAASPGLAAPTGLSDFSADGSMHHIAFKVSPDKCQEICDYLDEVGIEWTGGGMQEGEPMRLTPSVAGERLMQQVESGDVFVEEDNWVERSGPFVSIYLKDPDGILLEFSTLDHDSITRVGIHHEASDEGRREAVASSA